VSDDGQHGLTVIAFIGSVFSPYYAWARRKGPADPLNHCAVNVALYGPRGKHWAMTERTASAVQRDRATLAIGTSSLEWRNDRLSVEINERTMPWLRPLRGTITLSPQALPARTWTLASAGNHWWSPIAPVARIDVAFSEPSVSWSGNAYCDSNGGAAPLEDAFSHWHWSRAPHRDGTVALYDLARRDGSSDSLALRFGESGQVDELDPPQRASLPSTRWGIRRATSSDTGLARIGKTLEDTPFYARSLVHTRLHGENTVAMHESLSLNRFSSLVVQGMLPFRMPRVRG
jgi:carotenoid 1,2-hydratase